MTKERAAKIILDMINGAESTFGHSLSTTEIIALKKAYCALNPEPATNGERIRAMTDEELAHFISEDYYVPHCPTGGPCLAKGEHEGCEECWLIWLKKEGSE